MRRVSFSAVECPIARAAEQLGDAWTLLILRDAFFGARLFQDFEQRLSIPSSTLTRRLQLLCRQALLQRRPHEGHASRDEYVLTEKGLSLLPILIGMAVWGNRWLAPKGPLLVPIDATSGAPLDPVLVDRRSGRELSLGRVAVAVGSGASSSKKRGTKVLLGGARGARAAGSRAR